MAQMNMVQALSTTRCATRCARDAAWSCSARTSASSAACSASTAGLQKEFGDGRACIDTPLAEAGIIGTAIGHGALRPAAGAGDPVRRLHLPGVRPDRERGWPSCATARAASTPCPMVIRTPSAAASAAGTTTRRRPRRSSSTRRASRSCARRRPPTQGPAARVDPRRRPGASSSSRSASTARCKGEVPEGEHIGAARQGEASSARATHVTVSAYGAMVYVALEAAEQAAAEGVEVEVIDLRTLVAARHRADRPGVGEEDRPRASSCTRRRRPAASAPRSRR